MGSILRIVSDFRIPKFQKDIKIGICHTFKGEEVSTKCGCNKKKKPEPYHVATFKINKHC